MNFGILAAARATRMNSPRVAVAIGRSLAGATVVLPEGAQKVVDAINAAKAAHAASGKGAKAKP